MDGVILKFNDNKFWYVQADGPFEDWLLAHSENFDVKILIQSQGFYKFKVLLQLIL